MCLRRQSFKTPAPIIQPEGHSVSHKHSPAIALHSLALSLTNPARKTENPICEAIGVP